MKLNDLLPPGAGDRIKKVREMLGYSKKQMAGYLELSLSAYYKNEGSEAYPHIETLYRLAKDHDISLDWFIMGRGTMFCKDKPGLEEMEKKLEELTKELEMKRKQDQEDREENASTIKIKPEVRELVLHMDRIPWLYHEVLAFFQEFKVEHKELIAAEMGEV
jgi:transcriptional regulator with XRE-family HTH domain